MVNSFALIMIVFISFFCLSLRGGLYISFHFAFLHQFLHTNCDRALLYEHVWIKLLNAKLCSQHQHCWMCGFEKWFCIRLLFVHHFFTFLIVYSWLYLCITWMRLAISKLKHLYLISCSFFSSFFFGLRNYLFYLAEK